MNRKFLLKISVLFFIIASLSIYKLSAVNTEEPPKGKKSNYSGYNVIMISLGNVGTQHMSLYGYPRKTTPFIDNWAQDAVVFESFFSPASWTLPVATSLFTSLQPYSHKVLHRRHDCLLDERVKTLPEILKDAGYRTASFTGGLDYAHSWGMMRGFMDYDNNQPFTSLKTTFKQAKLWLDNRSGKNFFLFIHGYDAHCPFTPPDDVEGIFSANSGKNSKVDNAVCLRGYENIKSDNCVAYYFKDFESKKVILKKDDIEYLKDLYDEEVFYEDSLLAGFLKSLDRGLLENTIVIITAEHGEMFAKHGRFGRAGTVRGTLYDDVVHVPLVIKFPKGRVLPKRISALAQTVDVMPTLLDILGIPAPGHTQGRSLFPLMESDTQINDYVFAGTRYWLNPFYQFVSVNESIRSKEWKLIHEEREAIDWSEEIRSKLPLSGSEDFEEESKDRWLPLRMRKWEEEKQIGYDDIEGDEIYELYDVKNDPEELNNVKAKFPAVFKELKKRLEAWSAKAKSFDIKNISAEQFSPEMRKKIKEHGYW